MDLCDILGTLLIGYLVIQAIRLVFADADLSVLWAARFGKNPSTLSGKIVWITGASSGIGEYLAYDLARVGCKLVLSARREEELLRVKKQCLANGGVKDSDILVLPMDMTDIDNHKKYTQKVLEHFGQIDILMNNAGRSQRAFVIDTEVEVDRQMMELNAISVFSLTKAVLPHMIKRKTGHLVVTSSIAGKVGAPFSATYCATKFAIQGWFDALRIEMAQHNITVTTICPGPVHSAIQREAFTAKSGVKYSDIADMSKVEKRVATSRCSELITVAIANKLEEVWISLNPVLMFTYAAQYMPSIARSVGKKMGVKVINQLREGQL